MKKIIYAFLFALLLLTAASEASQAGGWAVVTLDTLPKDVVAGQPFTVSFGVRQHGRTLMSGLSPKITLINSEAGESDVVMAKAVSEKMGYYEAILTFPIAGAWKWTIDAFGAFPQPMPNLNVLAAVPVKKAEPILVVSNAPARASRVPAAVPLAIGLMGLLGTGVALFYWFRRQSGSAFALSIVAALIGLGGLAFAALPAAPSKAEASPVVNAQSRPSAAEEAASSPTQYGRDLFLAKGCVVCHAHAAFTSERASAGLTSFIVGPNLSNTQMEPGYMHIWLKDPAAAKGPAVEMPTLGLSDVEIDALVVFLTAKMAQ